jgi:hypothetical protein
MKTSHVFLLLRLLSALVLARGLFSLSSGAAGSGEIITGVSEALVGDASLEGIMRIATAITGLGSMVLLLLKKPAAISSGAFLAVVLLVAALVAQVTLSGINPVPLIIVLVGLIASLVVLFRFRGSLPVLGKFT